MSSTAPKVSAARAAEKTSARGTSADTAAKASKPAARKSTVKKAPAPPTKKSPSSRAAGTGKTAASASKPAAQPGATMPEALPVRAGEDAWTAAELAEVETELLSEADRLRAEIGVAENDIADLLRDSGEGAGDDQADTGTKNFEREHEMSIANNSRDMLSQTERALARIAAGTYGVCESCGQPIGKARLQVFPRATLCVSCKQREERR
jgi:DnaK suppressor protein